MEHRERRCQDRYRVRPRILSRSTVPLKNGLLNGVNKETPAPDKAGFRRYSGGQFESQPSNLLLDNGDAGLTWDDIEAIIGPQYDPDIVEQYRKYGGL